MFSIFHHLGFSYYQYIRHAYRLFPESIGYMFLAALTMFLKISKDYLKMNLLFAISVFLAKLSNLYFCYSPYKNDY